jgi:hypothetical protein
MADVTYRCPKCGNRDSAPEGYWRGDPPCSAGPPCDGRMKEVVEPRGALTSPVTGCAQRPLTHDSSFFQL